MSICRILNSFDRLSESELSTKTQRITNSMNGNPNFTDPIPTIEEVTTKGDNFDSSLIAARSGDRTKIAIKNEKRLELIDTIHRLARYVEMVANGNRSILMSSGFDVTKERSSSVELEQPKNVKLSDGNNSGELYVSCDGVQGAKSYMFQNTTDPLVNDNVWTSEVSTKSEYTFKGLGSGKKYWCRIIAIGSNDQQTISIPVSRFVQ